jgi:cytochrome d ubiquinol oxidase subunit II
VPLNAQGYFFEPLWTDLDPRSLNPGILDWYTVLIGGLAGIALVLHGAHFLALKTEAELQARARRIAARAWPATIILAVLGTAATFYVRSGLLLNFGARPWGFGFPLVAVAGLVAVRYFAARGRDGASLVASSFFLAGMLASSAFALYPDVLPATGGVNSLTVNNAAAPQYGLIVGLAWWIVGMALAAIYFVLIYRLFWGKVRLTDEGY